MSIIDGKEWLYRYVPASPDARHSPPLTTYQYINGGRLKLSYTAFNDRECKPSCDRASLLGKAEDAKSVSTDGVIKIQVMEVEDISGTQLNDETNGRKHYAVFDPIIGSRPAHSKIITEPAFSLKGNPEKRRWRAFQELLALTAGRHGWVIKP